MFEVLLQADRAIASGALDQAERLYWQLVELDPTNAIAVAGLARVALNRGDVRMARDFAERALAMDPEDATAKRILEAMDSGTGLAGFDAPDSPLQAAQRLEAMGMRHATAGADRDAEATADAEADAEQLTQLPPEPLPERRQAGRDAAAAAAAAAQAAPRSSARYKHQALGDRARRHLNHTDLIPLPRTDDPFANAESAAAIEAVDQTDDVEIEDATGQTQLGESIGLGGREPEGELLGDVGEDESIAMRIALISDAQDATEAGTAEFGAIEATGEDESIAMRVALVSGAELETVEVELQAAELEAAELEAAELKATELEATARVTTGPKPAPGSTDEGDPGKTGPGAEILDGTRPASEPSHRIDLAALAELRTEARLAGPPLAEEPQERRGDIDSEAAPAAAIPAAAEPVEEESARPEAVELEVAEPATLRPEPLPQSRQATEEDAETAAFREALAMVLDSDNAETARAYEATQPESATEAPPSNTIAAETADDPAGADPTAGTKDPTQPRRKGLFRRFRGD